MKMWNLQYAREPMRKKDEEDELDQCTGKPETCGAGGSRRRSVNYCRNGRPEARGEAARCEAARGEAVRGEAAHVCSMSVKLILSKCSRTWFGMY